MGGVLAASWRLYRLSFRHCWLLALLAAAQSALLAASLLQPTRALTSVWNDAILNMDLHALHASGIQFARATGGPVIASALLSVLLLAAIMVAPLALAAGAPAVGAISALWLAVRRLPWLVLGSVLTLLLVGGGLVLLLIPGLYWWGRVQLWLVPVLAEGAHAPRAIGRSWELTRGHWWRVSTLVSIPLTVLWLGSASGAWIGAELGDLAAGPRGQRLDAGLADRKRHARVHAAVSGRGAGGGLRRSRGARDARERAHAPAVASFG
jgi:hypothetical protein